MLALCSWKWTARWSGMIVYSLCGMCTALVTNVMDIDHSLCHSLNSSSHVIFVHDNINNTSSDVVLALTVLIPRVLLNFDNPTSKKILSNVGIHIPEFAGSSCCSHTFSSHLLALIVLVSRQIPLMIQYLQFGQQFPGYT